MTCSVPVERDALVAGVELDGQPTTSKSITEGEEGILCRENIDVAQPANELAVLNPRAGRDDSF